MRNILLLSISILFAMGSSAALAQDAVKVDPNHYKLVFENEHVRVLRITYGPHEKSVMHEHPASVGVVLTDNQRWRFTAPDGSTEDDTNKIGEAIWLDAAKHVPENLTDQTAEVILVELKKSAEHN